MKSEVSTHRSYTLSEVMARMVPRMQITIIVIRATIVISFSDAFGWNRGLYTLMVNTVAEARYAPSAVDSVAAAIPPRPM